MFQFFLSYFKENVYVWQEWRISYNYLVHLLEAGSDVYDAY